MGSFWHPAVDFFWSQIAPWATPVADSSTFVAHRGSLKMLCLLEFQAHNGQVDAALLPNLYISNRLLSIVAVQPPSKCPSMTFVLNTHENLVFPSKNGTCPEARLIRSSVTGFKNHLCGPPGCALIINANKFAMSRPKMHSYEVNCISYPFHCLCYAETMESLVFPFVILTTRGGHDLALAPQICLFVVKNYTCLCKNFYC